MQEQEQQQQQEEQKCLEAKPLFSFKRQICQNQELNKNRLCSKTCGIDNIVKKSKEKNCSEIQSELFIMTGNSSGLDPTPKRNHKA